MKNHKTRKESQNKLPKEKTMSNFLKSHTWIVSLALCLIGILSFLALEKDRCLEINLQKDIEIKVNCKITAN